MLRNMMQQQSTSGPLRSSIAACLFAAFLGNFLAFPIILISSLQQTPLQDIIPKQCLLEAISRPPTASRNGLTVRIIHIRIHRHQLSRTQVRRRRFRAGRKKRSFEDLGGYFVCCQERVAELFFGCSMSIPKPGLQWRIFLPNIGSPTP